MTTFFHNAKTETWSIPITLSNSEGDAPPPYAHSRNVFGKRQNLRDHLDAVSSLAAGYASAFESADLGRTIGLWHDLGKFNPEWQRYLIESEAGNRARGTGPDHKGTGTVLAAQHLEPLAFPVAGHHGGLQNSAELKSRLVEWKKNAASILAHVPGDLKSLPATMEIPAFVVSELDAEFYIRLLFSALVDADYLDTEGHLRPDLVGLRAKPIGLDDLWTRFERFHAQMPSRDDTVSRVRSEVYDACLAAAELPPGIFRLTVPTGGGKTLSGMAFALRHALRHQLRRVIVAVPYTSITEQTASVYRDAFGSGQAVLEHHSALDVEGENRQTEQGTWARLAAENWDASVIVTTTVQLFESLFAKSPKKCRKLHRIPGSVIILDEAQALPTELLAPILDVLQELATHYSVTVVLCTATQPALDDSPGFRGLTRVREIIQDSPRLFQALRRVTYERPDEEWEWERVAHEMASRPSALAIVNTRGDAVALYEALHDSDVRHLSTSLCGAHRRQVLKEVRRRLKVGQSCHLVSTQVVEAGVDLDFPLVLRAMGPLDRIVQAAGRCNREGLLASGRLVLFRPADGKLPKGSYRTATDITSVILRNESVDFDDPTLYEAYFRKLVELVPLDGKDIQKLRRAIRYDDVAQAFRMIEEDTISVLVAYDETAEGLRRQLIDGVTTSDMFRKLQPYIVAVPRYRFEQYRQRGLLEELRDDLFWWLGRYDDRLGIVAENQVLMG